MYILLLSGSDVAQQRLLALLSSCPHRFNQMSSSVEVQYSCETCARRSSPCGPFNRNEADAHEQSFHKNSTTKCTPVTSMDNVRTRKSPSLDANAYAAASAERLAGLYSKQGAAPSSKRSKNMSAKPLTTLDVSRLSTSSTALVVSTSPMSSSTSGDHREASYTAVAMDGGLAVDASSATVMPASSSLLSVDKNNSNASSAPSSESLAMKCIQRSARLTIHCIDTIPHVMQRAAKVPVVRKPNASPLSEFVRLRTAPPVFNVCRVESLASLHKSRTDVQHILTSPWHRGENDYGCDMRLGLAVAVLHEHPLTSSYEPSGHAGGFVLMSALETSKYSLSKCPIATCSFAVTAGNKDDVADAGQEFKHHCQQHHRTEISADSSWLARATSSVKTDMSRQLTARTKLSTELHASVRSLRLVALACLYRRGRLPANSAKNRASTASSAPPIPSDKNFGEGIATAVRSIDASLGQLTNILRAPESSSDKRKADRDASVAKKRKLVTDEICDRVGVALGDPPSVVVDNPDVDTRRRRDSRLNTLKSVHWRNSDKTFKVEPPPFAPNSADFVPYFYRACKRLRAGSACNMKMQLTDKNGAPITQGISDHNSRYSHDDDTALAPSSSTGLPSMPASPSASAFGSSASSSPSSNLPSIRVDSLLAPSARVFDAKLLADLRTRDLREFEDRFNRIKAVYGHGGDGMSLRQLSGRLMDEVQRYVGLDSDSASPSHFSSLLRDEGEMAFLLLRAVFIDSPSAHEQDVWNLQSRDFPCVMQTASTLFEHDYGFDTVNVPLALTDLSSNDAVTLAVTCDRVLHDVLGADDVHHVAILSTTTDACSTAVAASRLQARVAARRAKASSSSSSSSSRPT